MSINESSDSDDVTYEAEVASLEEFKNLQNLINLEIHIKEHAKMFPKNLIFKKLETFRISIGRQNQSSDYIASRTLHVIEYSTLVEFDSVGTKALMTRAESLLLAGVMSAASVSGIDPKGFSELKHLKVECGDGIRHIVKKNYNTCIFPKLQTLDLCVLDNLERICDELDHPLPDGSFETLRVITVSRCHLLNDLLSSNLARCLLRLKEIRVEDCKSMETIIVSREGENEDEINVGFTHQLRVLKLFELPCLVSFYNFKQLEELPSPTPFFNKKIVFPKLEVLDLSWMKIEKIWDDHLAIAVEETCGFENLTSLTVNACDNLRYLFTSSMGKSLAKLKQLGVCNCKSIEEIVAPMERETTGDMQLSFPNLDSLELEDLPKLKRFCHANLLECQSLRKLLIRNCPELETFMSSNDSTPDSLTTLFSEKVAFPNIEELKISSPGNFKMICRDQLHPNSFSRLKILEIECLRDLLNVFTPSMSRRALDLEVLVIAGCDSLENVFDDQILSMNERETCRVLPLQNLRSVYVSGCPSLTSIFPTSLVPTRQQLERFEVRNCDKVDLFGFNDIQQLNDAFAKVTSNLKYCHLESGHMVLKYEDQRFILKIDSKVSPILLSALLKSFSKLDKVVVSSYSVFQMLPCEPDHPPADDGNDMGTQGKACARIQYLKLTRLLRLKHIWSKQSLLEYHGIPLNPEVLEVAHFNSLLSLSPPSKTLFKNLVGLVVRDCRKLIKLIASSSAAKSLVNLKQMSVRECDSLKEIVVIDDQREGSASNDEYIVFDKLEVLKLQDLKSLTSFCSTSNCNFRFPSLNRVIVENCPNMKCFSMGALSTPKLLRVWPFWVEEQDEKREENQARWEGDLNSTIRQLLKKDEDEDDDCEDEEE